MRTRSAIVVRPPVETSATTVESRNSRPMRSNDGRIGGRCLSTSRYGSVPVSLVETRRATISGLPSAGLVARIDGRSTDVMTGGELSWVIIERTICVEQRWARRTCSLMEETHALFREREDAVPCGEQKRRRARVLLRILLPKRAFSRSGLRKLLRGYLIFQSQIELGWQRRACQGVW